MSKSGTSGELATVLSKNTSEEGMDAAQLCLAYQAALKDFVSGKTSRESVCEVSRLLSGALAARKQMLSEKEGLSAQRCHDFYAVPANGNGKK